MKDSLSPCIVLQEDAGYVVYNQDGRRLGALYNYPSRATLEVIFAYQNVGLNSRVGRTIFDKVVERKISSNL